MLDPRVGRWFAPDKHQIRGPEFSPYNFSFNSPISFSDPDGNWAIWVHYRMTKRALIKAGISRKTAKEIAYYASTYADDPNFFIRAAAKIVGIFGGTNPARFSKNEKIYQNSEMSGSQNDFDKNVTIHSMKAYFEGISDYDAVDRALNGGEFTDKDGNCIVIEGALNVIQRYKGKDMEKLSQNEKQEIGVAMHTIQDAGAHKGGKWADDKIHKKYAKAMGEPKRHSIWNDVFGSQKESKGATENAAESLSTKDSESNDAPTEVSRSPRYF